MLRALMTAPGHIEIDSVETPVPSAEQVLIRIMRIGVCGSDIHVWHGKHPYTSYPVVQGHEVAGEIAALGAGVSGFSVGDRVTVMPQVTCGQCYPCRHGKYHICDSLKVMGFQTTGTASEYFAADAAKVLRLPPDMGFEHGAMIEPLAVAVHALSRAGDVSGMKVAVLGGGPIGNLVAQTACALGADDVILMEVNPFRLELAGQCGIPHPVDTRTMSLKDAIDEYFGPDGADLILECVGSGRLIGQAVSCARKGSDIIVVGVYGETPSVDLGLVQDKELRLIGTLMYQERDYIRAIEMAPQIKLGPLITHRFSLSEYADAYKAIETNGDKTMKIMICLNED